MPPTTPSDPRRPSRRALLVLAATLLLALCLRADARQATLFGLPGPLCPVGDTLGPSACPGCGLVRSTALAVHGDWGTAAALHPAGILVVLLCAAGVVVHADILRRRRRTVLHHGLLRAGRACFVLGLAAAWVWRLALPPAWSP